jgi:hypothetical protein
MNLLKTLFFILFLSNFLYIGFSETIIVDGVESQVQDNVLVTEIYEDTNNLFIFMLITGFTVISIVTLWFFMREINLSKQKLNKIKK